MKKFKSFYQEPTFLHLVLGVGVGAAIVFAAMLLCAFVLTLRDFNPSISTPLSNICLAIGAAVGGFVCSNAHRTKGMIMGAATGFILFAVVTAVALIVNGAAMTVNTPVRLGIMSVMGAGGGIFGVNKASKHKMI